MYDLALSTINDEPRILDTDLAEALGFKRPADIRELIQRHRSALDELGVIRTVRKSTGGRPATEHYLNQEQALFITSKSETPLATKVTIQVVQKFMAYERGEIVSERSTEASVRVPSTFLEALEALVEVERGRARLAERLEYMTLDAFRALHKGVYWSPSFKGKVSGQASRLARESGVMLGKEPRTIHRSGKEISSAVNIYPVTLLEEALAAVQ